MKKTLPTKAEALAWERHIQATVQRNPDWMPPKKDSRRLSELVDLWHRHHGSALRDGESRKRILLAMCNAMGNPLAEKFTPDQFAEYRLRRITAGLTPNTMNREQAYLRAVFNENIRLGHWTKENPLTKLRSFKIQERELSYLTTQQIKILLEGLSKTTNNDVNLVARICLATGARWGEAEGLRISQIRNGVIQFVHTKSSKARAVPISQDLETELRSHYEANDLGDRLFMGAYEAFREGVKIAKLTLPKGQLTHILRHTFASHFVMNGGNILALQKILGHHSLAMTIRYAHLSPDHLQETKHLNPLAKLNRC